MSVVLGVDSRFTTTIPEDTEYQFIGIKISDGVGGGPYSQPLIQWERATELGLKKLPFHFWRGPGSDDPFLDGQEQAEWFWELYEKHFLPISPAELPPVIDAEDKWSLKGLRALNSINSALKRSDVLWEREALAYSAGWWWDQWIKPYTFSSHEIYQRKLWEADPPPETPIGYWEIADSVITQIRLDFAKAGFTASIDENVADLAWYLEQLGGGSEPPPGEEPAPIDIAEELAQIREATTAIEEKVAP